MRNLLLLIIILVTKWHFNFVIAINSEVLDVMEPIDSFKLKFEEVLELYEFRKKRSNPVEDEFDLVFYLNQYFIKPIYCFVTISEDGGNVEYDPKQIIKLPKASIELINEIQYYVPFTGASYCNTRFGKGCKYCQKVNSSIIPIYDVKTKTKVVVIVNSHRQEIVIAYRGSERFYKLIEAASIVELAYPGVTDAFVHKNHQKFVESVQFNLIEKLNLLKSQEKFKNYRIVILGHSLGGSLAALSAPLIARDLNIQPSQIRIITYGQPRSGNKVFAKWYNKLGFNFTRVVNYADPIVSHPPLKENWSHVHTEVFIAKNKQYYICETLELEHPDCSYGKASMIGILNSHKYVGSSLLSSRGC